MAKHEQVTQSTELVLSDDAESLAGILIGANEAPVEDPAAIQAAIIRRILAAETAEEAMADTPTYSTKDIVGLPFEVSDVRVARSRYGTDGRGGFLVCYVTLLDDGEQAILTTSAGKVAAKIAWHKLHGELPMRFVIPPPVESGQGFKVFDIAYA